MKYILADKLIAEIERFSSTEYGGNTLGDDVANGALDYVLEEIIPSLQQEQSETDLEREIIRYKVPFSDDKEYLNETTLDSIAHHFYELGLNARKV